MVTTEPGTENGIISLAAFADRPAVRSQLPFRLSSETRNGKQVVVIEFTGELPDGRPASYRLEVQEPENRLIERVSHPLPYRVLELMRTYWELESTVDGLMKERDELAVKVSLLEGQIKTLGGQLHDVRGKAAKAK